jgi:hypothetical protein
MLWADDSLTERARSLKVDVLATPEGSSYDSKAIVGTRWHWPFGSASLMAAQPSRTEVLDLRHAILALDDLAGRRALAPGLTLRSVAWSDDDPLGDVLIATFGKLPDSSLLAFDYQTITRQRLTGCL